MRDNHHKNEKIIALAGNPNVGKSTLFNMLTGMKQHTGNWAGKTVSNAVGSYDNNGQSYTFVDIPGTYSLMAHSAEEQVARDFLIFNEIDTVIVVCDATCLERNLNLALQITEITNNVIVCVNLMDEAKKKGIKINLKALSERLGLPVVGTSARNKKGIDKLIKTLEKAFDEERLLKPLQVKYLSALEQGIEKVQKALEQNFLSLPISLRWLALKLLEGDETLINSVNENYHINILKDEQVSLALKEAKSDLENQNITGGKIKDYIVSSLVLTAEAVCDYEVVCFENSLYKEKDLKIDKLLTGKITGPIFMLLLLALVFWLTVSAANYPSSLLWNFFSLAETKLLEFGSYIRLPNVISSMLFSGVFRVTGWVISVMLPPMAIFFPLFTLLEDLGYLPRVAFNLDNGFKKSSACGKQALSMCMGFGCNAVGITGCRIIDSKRERLIAIITNVFMPCNGRFPTLIAIITMFLAGGVSVGLSGTASAVMLTLIILLGFAATFLVSKLLSVTLLKGQPSSFTLELPPYRVPKVGSVIVRSIFDRTVFVLGRAVAVAAPAGLVIWLLANITADGQNLLQIISDFLDPFAKLIGLDGVILIGFILGFPANEIVIPIIIMAYMGGGTLTDYESLAQLKNILISNGWTTTTAICTLVFSLMHWPCSTAILTVKKETGSIYWSIIAFIVPTLCGMVACAVINLISHLF